METYNKLYDGISKVAWGYFFLYFNINLGTVSILPSFVGYILFLKAIDLLQSDERELSLLRTLGIILTVWNVIEWIATCINYSFGSSWQFVTIITSLVSMYFHFQLITNLASIATKYQQKGYEQDKKLLRYRTIQTIMQTTFTISTVFAPHFDGFITYIYFCLAIVYAVVCICIMKALFDLRKCLRRDETNTIEYVNE